MKFDKDRLIALALEHGFSLAGELNRDALVFLPEVRDMCAAGKCKSYGKSWSCPPACGTLEESRKIVESYRHGIIVETIGKMEDPFDMDAISETSSRHVKNLLALIEDLKKDYPSVLGMSAGTCHICSKCTYPDAPCRFPDKRLVSMEAYGLFVSDVCKKSGMPYYNGPLTTTFISCFLIQEE